MSTIIMQGGAGGITLQSLVSTAVNLAILYALFIYLIKPNMDKLMNMVPTVPNLKKFGIETYKTVPTSVDVFEKKK